MTSIVTSRYWRTSLRRVLYAFNRMNRVCEIDFVVIFLMQARLTLFKQLKNKNFEVFFINMTVDICQFLGNSNQNSNTSLRGLVDDFLVHTNMSSSCPIIKVSRFPPAKSLPNNHVILFIPFVLPEGSILFKRLRACRGVFSNIYSTKQLQIRNGILSQRECFVQIYYKNEYIL